MNEVEISDLAVEIATDFALFEEAQDLTDEEFWAEVARLEAIGEDWILEFID